VYSKNKATDSDFWNRRLPLSPIGDGEVIIGKPTTGYENALGMIPLLGWINSLLEFCSTYD